MKLLLLSLFICTSALASVTPEQMRAIRIEATNVMYSVGGEGELNATVTKVRVIDQLGDRVKVEFKYEELMYPERTCTFYFDLKRMSSVARSALCNG